MCYLARVSSFEYNNKTMGRPSKLTDETLEIVCDALRNCLTIEDAARLAGITVPTIYNWLEKGETAKSGKYRDFFNSIEAVKLEVKSILLTEIHAFAAGQKPTKLKEKVTQETPEGQEIVRERYFEPGRYTELLLKARYPQEFAALKIASDRKKDDEKDKEKEEEEKRKNSLLKRLSAADPAKEKEESSEVQEETSSN